MLIRSLHNLGIVVVATAIGWNVIREPQRSVGYSVVTSATTPVQVPANLESPEAIQVGAHLFRENCVQCHGAPGIAAAVQGLTPAPPNLLAAGRRNDPTEVFAKVTNGISGTAMRPFGDDLPDQSRWALAAFLHHSRGISSDAFDGLSTAKPDAGAESP
jgi:mono/diheme cytochrome c family protein